MIKKIASIIATAGLLVSLSLLVGNVAAQVSPPDFPACSEQDGPGDRAHYETGFHQIPGSGLLEGSDDVYTLENSNFLQCYCPTEGDDGIQTNWWRVGGLTQEEIDKFVQEGWIFENSGLVWNLLDERYLARNSESSCAEPTPTPTLTPTPTVTPTPTATPTPTPETNEPRCVGLSASPTSGTAHLTVKFTGSGFDPNGPILEYEFDFGDASGGQPQIVTQTEAEAAHRYENDGTYVASVRVKDQGGRWRDGSDDCKKTIEVNGKPRVLAATITSLPKTGAPLGIIFGLSTLSGFGAYLYKRFKLVN